MKINRCVVFLFSICLFVSSSIYSKMSFSGDAENEYLYSKMALILERSEDIQYTIAEVILNYYCPQQYREMQDWSQMTYNERFRTTLSHFHNEDSIFKSILEGCENRELLFKYNAQTTELVDEMASSTYFTLQRLMNNPNDQMSFERKRQMAEFIFETQTQMDMNVFAVLIQLRVVPEEYLKEFFSSIGNESPKEVQQEVKRNRADFSELEEGPKVDLKIDIPTEPAIESVIEAVTETELKTVPAAEGALQPKMNRCNQCSHKFKSFSYSCRCGGEYCAKHRFADQHECTFDHAAHQREKLKKENPVVTSDKLEKI